MNMLPRWLSGLIGPAVLAAGLGAGALLPVTAHAQDSLTRVLVDVADVVIRGGTPYYRYDDYRYDNRLRQQRDRYGRTVYFRYVPINQYRRDAGPRYGYAYRGDSRQSRSWNNSRYRSSKCNKHGKCKVSYYDPRQDRGRYDGNRDDRDDRRWRDHDDD